jgi:hypothetical protein
MRAATVELFTTAKTPRSSTASCGCGFGIGGTGCAVSIRHNGASPGVNVEFAMYPALGYEVVIVASQDPPVAGPLMQLVRSILSDVQP